MADFISRNRSPPRMQQNVSKKSNKKTPRRPVTPGKSKARTGRDHWMTALKKRQALTMSNVYRAPSPRHKTPTEFFVETLRKTGVGRSSETNKSQSMTGLNRVGGDALFPYRSTSHYMRQVMGTERASPRDDLTARPGSRGPNYKSQEEYYDEVLALRKQIAALSHESATSKTKIRRLEEDNTKKEREIEGLLNPTKNGELRRTLGDRQADSGAVVHSLKQKILKLEMQLRDREAAYCKLQADLKTTKIDEMRVQMEAMYAEVLRLQLSHDTGIDEARKENVPKVKALNETVIRLSKNNEQLQSENRALKDDLHRAMEESDAKLDVKKEHADKNRRELLATITQLERRLEHGGSRYDSDGGSVISQEGSKKTQGKLDLQGSLEDRLHQLDVRETELLDEVEKLRTVIRRSREERKRTGDESSLPPTPRRRQSRAQADDAGPGSRPTSSRRMSKAAEDSIRPGSSRSGRDSVENFRQRHAAKSIQRQWRQNRESQMVDEKNNAAAAIQRAWKHKQEKQRVEAFREKRAAKKIQHGWIDYKHRKYDEEMDDAADTIRSALRGHHTRRQRMDTMKRRRSSAASPIDFHYDTSSDTDENVYLIQSSLRGHRVRQQQLRSWKNQYVDDDEESVLSGSYGRRRTSPSQRPSSGYMRPMSGERPISGGSGSRPSSSGRRPSSQTRPGSGHRPGSASLMSKRASVSQTFKASYDVPAPSHSTRDSDDDDIMF